MKIRKKIDEWMKTAAPDVGFRELSVSEVTHAKTDPVGNF